MLSSRCRSKVQSHQHSTEMKNRCLPFPLGTYSLLLRHCLVLLVDFSPVSKTFMEATFPELQPQLEAKRGKALVFPEFVLLTASRYRHRPRWAELGFGRRHICVCPRSGTVPAPRVEACGMLVSDTASSAGYGISKEGWTVIPVTELTMESTYLYLEGQFR